MFTSRLKMKGLGQRRGSLDDDSVDSTPFCLGIRSWQGASRFFQCTPASPDSTPTIVAIANPQWTRTQEAEQSENALSVLTEPKQNPMQEASNSLPTALALQPQVVDGPLNIKCLPEASVVARMWKLVKGFRPKLVKRLASKSKALSQSSTLTSAAGCKTSVGKPAKLRKRGGRIGFRLPSLKIKYRFRNRTCGKFRDVSEPSSKAMTTAGMDGYKLKLPSSRSYGNNSDLCVYSSKSPEESDGATGPCAKSKDLNLQTKDDSDDCLRDWEDSVDMETPLLELCESGFQMLDALSVEPSHGGHSHGQSLGGLSNAKPKLSQLISPRWTIQSAPKWLHVNPCRKLQFHYQMEKKLFACSITLENKTLKGVAFKFMTTSPLGYLIRPKQGLLGPGATGTVRLVKAKETNSRKPASSSILSFLGYKKDLFVLVTLPLQPTPDMPKNKCLPIDASIFDERHAECWCEGTLTATFPKRSVDTNDAELDVAGANFQALKRSLSLGPH